MEAIQQWFDTGCNYDEGLQLYASLKTCNKNLLRLFRLKNTIPNQKKLEYELSKGLNSKPVVKKTIPIQKVITIQAPIESVLFDETLIEKSKTIWLHELPTELHSVYLEATSLFRENCSLKWQLNFLPEEAETNALELIKKIQSNFERNKLLWQKIQYFMDHRKLPNSEPSKFEGMTPGKLVQRQQLLYASISKLKARLKENRKLYKETSVLNERDKYDRSIKKQEANLIQKNEELQAITRLIEG